MKKILLLMALVSFTFANSQATCATAQVITAGTYTVTGVTGTDIPSPNCNGTTDGTHAEWYSYTATVTGAARVNTNLAANVSPNSDDTRIHIYTGTCGALVCHASNDDVDDANYLSDITFPVDAGVTYLIVFDDRWNAAGFDFELSEDSSQACNTSLPVNEDWTSVFGLGCWNVEDIAADGLTWSHNGVNDFNGDGTNDPIANIFPGASSGGPAKDDWLISATYPFDSTHSYSITVRSNSIHLSTHTGMTADESFDIVMLDSDNSGATATLLESVTGIVPLGAFGDTTGADPITMAYNNTNTFTPTTSGNYSVGVHAITPQGGDILFITKIEIVDNGVASIKDNELASQVSIYPTSTKDSFTINNKSNTALTSVSLFDVNGRVVLTQSLENLIGEKSINVSNLSTGMYFVQLNTANATVTKKLIKK